MSECPAFPVQLPLNIRAERTCLNTGQPGYLIDFKDTAHTAHIQRDYGAPLVAWRFKTAGDIGTSPEWNDNGVSGKRSLDDSRDLLFRARIDNQIRETPPVATPNPHKIAQSLAVGMHDPVKRIVPQIAATRYSLK